MKKFEYDKGNPNLFNGLVASHHGHAYSFSHSGLSNRDSKESLKDHKANRKDPPYYYSASTAKVLKHKIKDFDDVIFMPADVQIRTLSDAIVSDDKSFKELLGYKDMIKNQLQKSEDTKMELKKEIEIMKDREEKLKYNLNRVEDHLKRCRDENSDLKNRQNFSRDRVVEQLRNDLLRTRGDFNRVSTELGEVEAKLRTSRDLKTQYPEQILCLNEENMKEVLLRQKTEESLERLRSMCIKVHSEKSHIIHYFNFVVSQLFNLLSKNKMFETVKQEQGVKRRHSEISGEKEEAPSPNLLEAYQFLVESKRKDYSATTDLCIWDAETRCGRIFDLATGNHPRKTKRRKA